MSNPRTRRATVRVDATRIESDLLDKGWNASELARRAKLPASTVSRFLSGEVRSVPVLAKIARALGRRPSDYASVEGAAA